MTKTLDVNTVLEPERNSAGNYFDCFLNYFDLLQGC